MPSLPQSIPPPVPPAIDLSRVTEATRRQLYDIVAAVHFNPTPEEIRDARKAEEWYPTYGPDECGLAVFYFAGRWFAIWRQWDAGDDVPPDQEWEIVRAQSNPSAPHGVEFQEV